MICLNIALTSTASQPLQDADALIRFIHITASDRDGVAMQPHAPG